MKTAPVITLDEWLGATEAARTFRPPGSYTATEYAATSAKAPGAARQMVYLAVRQGILKRVGTVPHPGGGRPVHLFAHRDGIPVEEGGEITEFPTPEPNTFCVSDVMARGKPGGTARRFVKAALRSGEIALVGKRTTPEGGVALYYRVTKKPSSGKGKKK